MRPQDRRTPTGRPISFVKSRRGAPPSAPFQHHRWPRCSAARLGRIVLMGCLVLLAGDFQRPVDSLMMLATSCLAANCQCSWKSGKFVADCSGQNLAEVPQNDYIDHLLEGAESRMPTLNRDIQALNLSSNQLTRLNSLEFAQKNFRNLQKLQVDHNKLAQIRPSAFFKLTGLIELDLSDNQLERLDKSNGDDTLKTNGVAPETLKSSNQQQVSSKSRGASHDERRTSADGVAEAKSFLQHLIQLRSLNLNSNKLERIEKFAFTPLAQLRQLYLSRNQLHTIDKRAFDGLNELNVLHLDGNKLTHLNGEILLRLPQLHALQLAGPGNKWRCDCHLRKLVRLLRQKPSSRGAPNLAILQDRPLCEPGRPTEAPSAGTKLAPTKGQQQRRPRRHWLANDLYDGTIQQRDHSNEPKRPGTATKIGLMSGGDGESIRSANSIVSAGGDLGRQVAKNRSVRLTRPSRGAEANAQQTDDQEGDAEGHWDRGGIPWTNLALDQFECAPQLAASHLADGAGLFGPSEPTNVNRSRSIKLAARQLKPGKPIELTCPLKLVDELDVELTSVEWRYQFEEPSDEDSMRLATKLIWRSNDSRTNQSSSSSSGSSGSSGSTNATHMDQQKRRDLDKQRMTIMMKLDSGERGTSASDSVTGELHGGRIGLDWNAGSSQAQNWPPASTSADKLAIIDYVTRANASGKSDGARQSDHSSNDAASSNDGNDDNNKILIRLVHLILEPDETKLARGKPHQIWFLCQVSNLAGEISLWQPIEFEPTAGGESQSSERLRFPLTSNPGRVSSELGSLIERQVAEMEGSFSGPAPGNSSNAARLERVKSTLELEFAQLESSSSNSNSSDDHSNRVLFVPISVTPRRLLANIALSHRQPARLDSLERSLTSGNPDQVRPTKSRQATQSSQKNSTRGDGNSIQVNRWQDSAARNFGREIGSSRLEQTDQNDDVAEDTLQRSDLLPLQELALDAIGRFTGGGRSHLPDGSRVGFNQPGGIIEAAGGANQPDEVEGEEEEVALGEQLARAWRDQDHRLRELYRIFSARVAVWGRSSEHFTAVLPHLLAGLIVGCLLTLIILFKLNSCAPHDDDKHEQDTDSRRRRLPTVKLRRKIASECSSGGQEFDEAGRKSNSSARRAPEQAGQLGTKSVGLGDNEELVGDEISDQFDDAPDRRHERRQAARRARFEVEDEGDEEGAEDEEAEDEDDVDEELCSRYQLELSPLPPPPAASSSSGLELDVCELLQRAQQRRDGFLDQPATAAAAGSTGSATTTTSGSQRMLLPPRSCALGVGQRQHRTEFCATPSETSNISGGHVRQHPLNSCLTGSLTRTIQKSSTLQSFSSTGANNYERLMSAADAATAQLVLEPAPMTTATSASTWKGGGSLIGAGKSSTLQRPPPNWMARSSATMTSAARLGQRRWRPTGGNVESNNRRTVTWLMSNDPIRDDSMDYARAGGAVRPVYGELEVATLSGALPHWGAQSRGASGCLSIDNNNNNNNNNNSCSSNDLTSCTAELIGVAPQLEAHVSALRETLTTANQCWIPSEVNSRRERPVVHGRGSRGNKQVDFMDTGSGINILPACLCVDGQALVLDADGGNQRQVARGGDSDQVSDSDESYYLYRPIGRM